MADSRLCSIADCGKPHYGHGWCENHYRRWKRSGDPLGGKTSRGEAKQFFENVVIPYEGDDCLIWPFARSHSGYGHLGWRGKICIVSRLVCEDRYGPPPSPEYHASHSCGRGHEGCVSRKHLSWKRPEANWADRVIHGTHNRGEQAGRSKLKEDDVRKIRSLLGKTEQQELARRFGVSRSVISHIANRRTWAWLD